MSNSKLKFKTVESDINRWKKKKYPDLPKNLQEIKDAFDQDSTVEAIGKSITKQHRFYFDTKVAKGFAHQIYGSQAIMEFIENNIDATNRNYT